VHRLNNTIRRCEKDYTLPPHLHRRAVTRVEKSAVWFRNGDFARGKQRILLSRGAKNFRCIPSPKKFNNVRILFPQKSVQHFFLRSRNCVTLLIKKIALTVGDAAPSQLPLANTQY